MPTITFNKIRTKIGSDPYALTADDKAEKESMNVVIPVASTAEMEALPETEGLTVTRLDLRGQNFVFVDGGWRSVTPYAQAAGLTSVTFSNAISSNRVTVNLPTGRFSKGPMVVGNIATSQAGDVNLFFVNVTASSFEVGAYRATERVYTGTVPLYWQALQMTADDAAG